MTEQLNIWEMIYPKKIIEKPIKLIELFSGIGSQLKAMRLLSDKVTPYKTCEWEYTAIISYNAMHELGMSNSKLYFLAGNSIVVTVIVAIFSTLFSKDHEEIINHYINQEIKENKE